MTEEYAPTLLYCSMSVSHVFRLSGESSTRKLAESQSLRMAQLQIGLTWTTTMTATQQKRRRPQKPKRGSRNPYLEMRYYQM